MSILPRFYSPYDLSHGLDILLVIPAPAYSELETGEWLTSEENDFINDYLDGFEDRASWAVTSLFAQPTSKPKIAEIRAAAPSLIDLIQMLNPRLIVAMGGPPITALWPEEAGPVQGVLKAKGLDLLSGGRPLICTLDPSGHYWYLRTNGRSGSDLTAEYNRTFCKVGQMLEGTYVPRTFSYTCIDTPRDAQWLLDKRRDLKIKRMGYDTEDTTWWAKGKIYPHKWPVKLPEKLTLWHRDTELSWCSITWKNPQQQYEVFSLHPQIITWEFLHTLFYDCTVDAWNMLYEIASGIRFLGFDMCDPQHRIKLYDGMVRYAVRDQSITAIGLKLACQQHVGAPAWDVNLNNALKEAAAERNKECGVSISAIDDVEDGIARQYNCGDTYYMELIIDEYLIPDKDGGLHPECDTYDQLIYAIPFFARMEATGTLTDVDLLNQQIEYKEHQIELLEKLMHDHWAVQLALHTIGTDTFNPRTKFGFISLVAATHGRIHPRRELTEYERKNLKAPEKKKLQQELLLESLEVPDWAPLSESGKGIGTGKSAIAVYASGEGLPDDEYKATRTEIWSLLLEHKEHHDDLTKYYTLRNYTSSRDGRVHASYRIVKSLNESSDKASDTGTTSGRSSSTPNAQNKKPELKPCSIAPPGFTKVVFDVSGSEMVHIAENTGDPLFLKWAHEGKDTHLENAAILWGYANGRDPEEFFWWRSREEIAATEIHPEQKPWRKMGKTLNFAPLYLQEPSAFAEKAGLTVEEAIQKAYESRERSPGIFRAMCDLYNDLNKGLPAITNIFGRVRYANNWERSDQPPEDFLTYDPELKRQRNRHNMDLFRSIWNFWGAQADSNDYVVYKGMIIDRLLRNGTLDPTYLQMDTFIHDSLSFDCWTPWVPTIVPYIANIMEDNTYLPVPLGVRLRVSCETGPNMGALKPYNWR